MRPADDELRLLLDDRFSLEKPSPGPAAAGSLLYHLLAAAIVLLSSGETPTSPSAPIRLRSSTPLVAPPTILTQRDPNRSRISQELNLAGLLPRPETRPQAPPKPLFLPRPGSGRALPAVMPDPPALESQPPLLAQAPPGAPPAAPSPQIQSDERPRLAFERPGAVSTPPGPARIPAPPRVSVDEAVRGATKGSAGAGVAVGDPTEEAGGLAAALSQTPSPGRPASRLELLSDPMGIDFRPYLIRILASVRRNWFAVMPESVRMGRQGRVLVQFAVNRDGSVPKLVIAVPSGAEALDRAAVAGISASNPFPPLPPEFRGEQVRLQFTFLYNVASR